MVRLDQLRDYLYRSGDLYILPDNLIANDKGFMSYTINEEEKALVILNCYGDGRYWDNKAEELARKYGLSKIIFGTKRNYRAFERKYGYKLVGYILEKEVENG